MIVRLPDPQSAARWCEAQRDNGHQIGLVPTMGALHAGHVRLVERAIAENGIACASIFVNPLQFDDPRDLARYPRDLDRDMTILDQAGCHMAFGGTLATFFPESSGIDDLPRQDPGIYGEGLEGEHRPGHLQGVATIVDRLFRVVHPDRAYFGEKDFQQSLVVREIARRLGYPEIVMNPTVRDADGLALSSRNNLIPPADRPRSLSVYRALLRAKSEWVSGNHDADALRAAMADELRDQVDRTVYADLRDPENWQAESPRGNMVRAQALVAAYVGGVRLIDNMRLDA